MPGHVFISYAHEDQAAALQLREELIRAGFTVWMDTTDLLGGEDWELAIKRALRESSHVIAVVSANSVTKRGFVQKELREALDILDEFPPESIFIIPVRLDDSRPGHARLAQLHWIDLFRGHDSGVQRIIGSLRQGRSSTAPAVAPSLERERAAAVLSTPPVLQSHPLVANTDLA